MSPARCAFLAARLDAGFTPAIPRTAAGGAGEVIPLAHAFGPLLGSGPSSAPAARRTPQRS